MSDLYLIMRAEGEWEEYRTTPVEAWTNLEKANNALKEYQKTPDVLPEEDWDRLCEEVDDYESKLDKVVFDDYIDGILSLHKEWDTPEFREKLEASEELYNNCWGKPDYYLLKIDLKE